MTGLRLPASIDDAAFAASLRDEETRQQAERRWWGRELELLKALAGHPDANRQHPCYRPGGDRALLERYLMATRRHRVKSFTGIALPPAKEGGLWWARLHRCALIAVGQLRGSTAIVASSVRDVGVEL